MTRYVVAINLQEALDIAGAFGHETREAAEEHLKEVKAPPTDSYYANQYRIYEIAGVEPAS